MVGGRLGAPKEVIQMGQQAGETKVSRQRLSRGDGRRSLEEVLPRPHRACNGRR